MVAIFTGLGSGFERGSGNVLGGAGQLGVSLLGRGGESVSVNAATGNLVISRQDEFLVGLGPDAGISRTYNSLGDTGDRDNGDGWQQSTTRRIFGLTGTAETAGSTIKRLGADGSVITYAWGTKNSVTAYWATDGAGSYDRIAKSGTNWVWTDGDSRVTETFAVSVASSSEWRLIERKDIDGNKLTYSYLAGTDKLDAVTTQNGEWLAYSWSGNDITRITTGYTDLATSTAKTLTRTWYDYSGGKLIRVRTDLTPEDNALPSLEQSYWLEYGYDASGRVNLITQKDGSQVSVAYDGSGRVASITQTVAIGDTRVTSLGYGANYTSVTGPDGQVTRLDYDAAGQLTRITAPPAYVGAPAQVVQFAYNANGDLTSVTDANGKVTSYAYDANGNLTLVTDPNSNTVERWYDAANRVTLERSYGSYDSGTNVDQYVRYAYDSEGHLRYVIGAEGQVTEYLYTLAGQLEYAIEYPAHGYPVGSAIVSEATVNAWRDALVDRSSIRITSYTYDVRGNQIQSINYGDATAAGASSTVEGYTHHYSTYDQAGRLLTRLTASLNTESFVYDGMGRIVASTDIQGGTTTFVFNDAALTTTVTTAGGYTSVQTYNKAGELISSTGSGSFDVTGTSNYKYDKNGRLRVAIDETGYKTVYIYDAAGQLVGEANGYGHLTEYRRDAAGRVMAQVRYALSVSAANMAAIENPDNALQMSALRPAAHSTDLWNWTVYDAAGRVVQTIDGDGGVTAFEYDKSDRLVKTTSYYTKVAVAALKTAPPTAPVAVTANAKDTVSRSFYDRAGRLIGALDGEGYLSEIVYDEAGLKIEEIAYAARTSSIYWADGTFGQLRSSAGTGNADNRRTHFVYDGQGLLRYQVDSDGRVTQQVYWLAAAWHAVGLVRETIVHSTAIATSDFSYKNVKQLVTMIANPAADQKTSFTYDGAGRVATGTDAVGTVTTFTYDTSGRVTKTQIGSDTAARITRNYYTAAGLLRFTVDAEGFVRRYDYDAAGRKAREVVWDTAISVDDATTIAQVNSLAVGTWTDVRWEYDLAGRLSSTYDGLGNRTFQTYLDIGKVYTVSFAYETSDFSRILYAYDGAGRLVAEYTAHGEAEQTVTTHAYDGLGNRISTTDANGKVTSFTYDEVGRVLSVTDAAGGVTNYQYNAFGEVVQTTDARGGVTTNLYNKFGQLTRTTDALGVNTDYSYNQFGELASVTRAGATTSFEYDKLGRVTKSTDALGYYEAYTYDARGNRITSRNKLGGITTYAYDKRGLLVAETLPTGSYNSAGTLVAASITNSYSYDARGNRVQTVEAAGLAEQRTTSYVYDKANRLIQTTGQTFLGMTPVSTFAYDARGNLTRSTDPAGARTVYYYDDLDRVTASIDAVGTYTATTYDANGNVTGIKVYASIVAVPADGGSQEEAPAAPAGAYRETVFTYDALGRMVTSAVAGVTTGYWNGTSWVSSTASLTTAYQYDAAGNVVKTTDPNGNTIWSYYDALGRKTAQVDQENYLTTWDYNADGNVVLEYRHTNKVGTQNGLVATTATTRQALVDSSWYGLDDRFTRFDYDQNGNRVLELRYNVLVHNGSGSQTSVPAYISYLYNGLGQVTRKTEASGDQVNYTYDAGGRLTVEARQAFVDNTGATVTPTVDYYYDGLGNLSRTRQRGDANAAERVTTYGYDGGKLRWVRDAEAQDGNLTDGLLTYYWYNITGRQTFEQSARYNSAGAATANFEGILTAYDAVGRVTQKWQSIWNGTVWTDNGPRAVTTYNAYGEVASVAIGGVTQQQNQYDNAGRLIASNSGDGVWKHFGYDANGNQTIAVASAGASLTGTTFAQALAMIGQTDINATYTQYDKSNLATQVTEEGRLLAVGGAAQTLTTSRSYNAFGEIASETNALGATINYTYNTMGRLIKSESPSVAITLENGTVTTVRPTEQYYYDASGRLVATRDANNNLTRLTLLAGSGHGDSQALVTSEIHADGGVKTTKYDIHGDARELVDELGYRTLQTFDRLGRLTVRQELRNAALTTDDFYNYYTYDGLGQQLKHWNSQFGSLDAEITDYDIQGRVISSRAFGGDVTTTSYVWEAALVTSGLGTFGGWSETTTMANGLYSVEKTDLFGRTTYKRDLGAHVTSYTYDIAGRLAKTNLGGLDTVYTWLNSGFVGQVWTGSPNSGQVNTSWNRTIASYSYDKVGNRLSEQASSEIASYTPAHWETVENPYDPGSYDWEVWEQYYGGESYWVEESYSVYSTSLKNQTASYDALGRLRTWNEVGTVKSPASAITNEYDAAGNVRRTLSTYRSLDANGTANSTATSRDYWFRYDSMNRVVVNQGLLSNGVIVRGSAISGVSGAGQDVAYNAAGQRTSVTVTNGYLDGYTGYTYSDSKELYYYDAGGRLTETRQLDGTGATGTGLRSSLYGYDLSGRQTSQTDYGTNGTTAVFSRTASYNSKNQVVSDYTSNLKTDGKTYTSSTSYNYGVGAGSMLGAVVSQSSTNQTNGGSTTYTSTTNGYVWYDGALQKTITYDSNTLSSSNPIYTTTFTYNTMGQLTSAYIADGKPHTATFTNDELGQIIRRDETSVASQTGAPHEVWYRFGGRQLGYTGNNGTSDMAMAASIADRQVVAPTDQGTFRNKQVSGSAYADFAQNYDPINSFYQGAAGGSYTVRSGDSLQGIAQNLYGDASLWYKIAEANGLGASSGLIEGQRLILPTGVVRNTNNASSFKTYDPAEAIGDLSPSTNPKPKKAKCGAFGQVLLAAIAIAVTVALTPASSPAFGEILLGALAGNVASQAVGVATGIQSKFSFKSLAITALTAGVTAGIGDKFAPFGAVADGAGGSLRAIATAATKGALASALSQGVGVATGLQDKFSWAGVAAAGVAAGVGQGLGDRFGLENISSSTERTIGNIAAQTAVSAASLIASAATRSAINGSSFGDNIKAGLPDVIGQTIGRALGGALRGGGTRGSVRGNIPIAALADGTGSLASTGPVEVLDLPTIDINPVTTAAPTAGSVVEAVVERSSGSSSVIPETIGNDIIVTGRRISSDPRILSYGPNGLHPSFFLSGVGNDGANYYPSYIADIDTFKGFGLDWHLNSQLVNGIASHLLGTDSFLTRLEVMQSIRAGVALDAGQTAGVIEVAAAAEAIYAGISGERPLLSALTAGANFIANAVGIVAVGTSDLVNTLSVGVYNDLTGNNYGGYSFSNIPRSIASAGNYAAGVYTGRINPINDVTSWTSDYSGAFRADIAKYGFLPAFSFRSDQLGQATGIGVSTLAGGVGAARSLGAAGTRGIVAAERIGGYLPNAGGVVRQFSQEGDAVYFRVFSEGQTGSFLTRVPPRSSAYAREALALPPENQAAFIQRVTVPNGTSLLRSRTLPLYGRSGGAEQFQLLNRIPNENFGPGVPLP